MQSHPDASCWQTIPIVDPGRYFEPPVNFSSDSSRSTNSRACVKMCLATRISFSKESADFPNVIPVVAVGDIVVGGGPSPRSPRLKCTRCPAVAGVCHRSSVHAFGRVIMKARRASFKNMFLI